MSLTRSLLILSLVLLFGIAVYITATAQHEQALGASYGADCVGTAVTPTQNLTTVAASNPSGTTFCLADGTYNVSQPVVAQSNDRFIGVYSDSTRPQVKAVNGSPYGFDCGGSTGAYIANLGVSGATGINTSHPYPGRGIHSGTSLTIDNVRAYNNKNSGIGGAGPGLLVQNSEVDHNGDPEFYNKPGFPVDSAGVKSVSSMKVINSNIHDNEWVGVWCDGECGDGPGGSTATQFEVRDNRIVNNGGRGIFYEISYGPAIVEGNTIQGNGAIAKSIGRTYAGLLVTSSQDLDAHGNTFGSNVDYGFRALNDSRSPDLSGIRFHDNTMNGDPAAGCTTTGVTCTNNQP